MDFYKVIESRKSIKKYKTTKISEEKVDRIINSAMMSPSWKNRSSYKFILVDDISKKNMLADTIINSTDEAKQSVKDAPMAVLVVGDPELSGEVAEKQYYLVDAAIAMEHFILAATAEGYGTTWIASLDEDKIRSIFGIPNNLRVVGITPLGEIAESKEHYEKKDISQYAFINEWNKAYSKERNLVMH